MKKIVFFIVFILQGCALYTEKPVYREKMVTPTPSTEVRVKTDAVPFWWSPTGYSWGNKQNSGSYTVPFGFGGSRKK